MGRVFQIALRCREMRNFAWGIFFIGRWESDKEWFWRWPVCTNEVKKRYRNNATAKMKFLLVYNMNIVGGEGSETLVGNKNLLEGGGGVYWADFPSQVVAGWPNFWLVGKTPFPSSSEGGSLQQQKPWWMWSNMPKVIPNNNSVISQEYAAFLLAVRYT